MSGGPKFPYFGQIFPLLLLLEQKYPTQILNNPHSFCKIFPFSLTLRPSSTYQKASAGITKLY